MRITCPECRAGYDVPDGAIGPNGRKVRCRACGAHWVEGPPPPPSPPIPIARTEPSEPPHPVAVPERAPLPVPGSVPAAPPAPAPSHAPPIEPIAAPVIPARPRRRLRVQLKLRAPLLALGLGTLVLLLGAVVAVLAFGPQQVASGLGLGGRRVDLGIAITRQPDWRTIAGGSQLFAVSGRIWNESKNTQSVPDIRAELKDAHGRTVYSWTITRPVASLAPGQGARFDGAAVDVPESSSRIVVSFAGTGGG